MEATSDLEVYTRFEWDMGDGTVYSGLDTVYHTYEEPGTYTVRLRASNGISGPCSNKVNLSKEILIDEVEFDDPEGPVSICPGAKLVNYTVNGANDNTYEWAVFGGDIIGDSQGKVLTVNWGGCKRRCLG